MSLLSLFLLASSINSPLVADTVRARVVAVIGENSPRTPFLLGSISGLALDEMGRLYVTDFQDPRVVVFAGDGKHLVTIGRKGEGPGEFRAPTGPVFGPDGALYVRNMSKVLRFAPDPKTGIANRFERFFEGPPMAPWQSKLSSMIDAKGRFHFPLEVGLKDGLTHYAYQRYSLDGKKLDSIAVPLLPTARSSWASVTISEGTGRIVKGLNVVPFHPMPVWAVTSAGTILSGPADKYTLSETDVTGRQLRTISRTVAADRIPSSERSDSLRALKQRIDSLPVPLSQVRGASPEVLALRLPETLPFYRGVTVAFEGTIWVRRWSPTAMRKVSLFDLFTAEGRHSRTVVVPVDCAASPAPVVRGGKFACVAVDAESGEESVVLAEIGK